MKSKMKIKMKVVGSIRQVLYFNGSEERFGTFQISFGECLEYLHVEVHTIQVFVIFVAGIGTCTEEITVVGEDETRHYRIEINDAKHFSVFIEHHVVYFRIAMAYSFRKFSFAEQAFCLAHFVRTLFYLVQIILYFGYSSGSIGSDCIT